MNVAQTTKPIVTADPRQQAIAANWPSVNALAAPLVRELILQAKSLRLGVERLANAAASWSMAALPVAADWKRAFA